VDVALPRHRKHARQRQEALADEKLGMPHDPSTINPEGLRPQDSGLRLQASGLRPQTSGLRLQASGLRPQASGLRLENGRSS
jgi:hypothetical protein